MRPARNRQYGHPNLLGFIDNLSQKAHLKFHGLLLVGDLAQPRGGPLPSSHVSHQTGLDADIWYELGNETAWDLRATPESHRATSVLNLAKTNFEPGQWYEAQSEILRWTSQSPEVARIFVNPLIKVKLCKSLPPGAGRAWLQKIRPWPGHDDHFHVRLYCPKSSVDCHEQAPPPDGDGCAAAIAALQTPEVPPTPEKSRSFDLPFACRAVLEGN